MTKLMVMKLETKRIICEWLPEEENILRMFWSSQTPINLIEQMLPRHPRSSIVEHGKAMGLQRPSFFRDQAEDFELTQEDAAYIAGFLDGDGSIFSGIHKGSVMLRVFFSNTNLDMLIWLKEKIGGNLKDHKRYSVKHKTQHSLSIESHGRILKLVGIIEPYLHIKREQAQIAIELIKSRMAKPRKSAYTDEELEMVQRIKMLNRRGP